MSLEIDASEIETILLPEANWVDVEYFEVDAYEIGVHHPEDATHFRTLFSGGSGFRAKIKGTERVIRGPITSILAVGSTEGEEG